MLGNLKKALGKPLLRKRAHNDLYQSTVMPQTDEADSSKVSKLLVEDRKPNVNGNLESEEDEWHYEFPSLDQLCTAEEQQLRSLGFGYRAKYVVQSAKLIRDNGGVDWLKELRRKSSSEVREALLTLPGVGPKVADCIALFSLDKFSVVPIDTHVWQLVEREYNHVIKNAKTLTKRVYTEIGDFFEKNFGKFRTIQTNYLFSI